jgi:hypothetical protein
MEQFHTAQTQLLTNMAVWNCSIPIGGATTATTAS